MDECLGWCWLHDEGVAHRGGASRSLLNESDDLKYHRDFMFLNKFVELRGVYKRMRRGKWVYCLGWCWLLEQGVAHRGGASRSLLNESEDLEYHRDFMFLNTFVELRGVQKYQAV